jgi:2,3-bisphosphoglycerate-dependent phosphoglycerate mutase
MVQLKLPFPLFTSMSTYHEALKQRYDGIYVPEGGTLALVRHGTSDGNKDGRWTGREDVRLAVPKGFQDAQKVARYLEKHEIIFDGIYTSTLQRARTTATVIEQELLSGYNLEFREIPTISISELDERDFGKYTGWKRDEVIKKVGLREFNRLRRNWNARIPADRKAGIKPGESMEDVAIRLRPRLLDEIVPRVANGENILLVAHSNIVRVALAELHELPPGKTHETLVVNNGECISLKLTEMVELLIMRCCGIKVLIEPLVSIHIIEIFQTERCHQLKKLQEKMLYSVWGEEQEY